MSRDRKSTGEEIAVGENEEKAVTAVAEAQKAEKVDPVVETVAPVIMDAGSCSKAAIRRLKEGRGNLMREVSDIVHEVRTGSTPAAGGIVPVVIIYRQKRRRRSRLGFPTPLDFLR